MRSHRATIPKRVVKGKAVLDACAQTKRLRIKIVVKSSPGTNKAVCHR